MAYPVTEDRDVEETKEWLASLEYILENGGTDRANFLLERLSARMTKTGARLPYTITTALPQHHPLVEGGASCRAICSWSGAYAP